MSAEPIRDVYRQDLPTDRALTGEDLRRLRFGVTLRGYAMGQVDDLLDRLSDELAERDRRIADLETLLAERGLAERGLAERGVAERGVAERGTAEGGSAAPDAIDRASASVPAPRAEPLL